MHRCVRVPPLPFPGTPILTPLVRRGRRTSSDVGPALPSIELDSDSATMGLRDILESSLPLLCGIPMVSRFLPRPHGRRRDHHAGNHCGSLGSLFS